MQVVGGLFHGYYGFFRLPMRHRSAFRLRLVHQDRSYHVNTAPGLPG